MNESATESAPSTPVARPRTFARHVRRYMTVGALSTVADFTVLGMLTYYARWTPAEANLISRPCGGVVSFAINKLWTFERREARGTGSQLFRYLCVWLSAYAMSELLVWTFSNYVNWAEMMSKISAEWLVNSIGATMLSKIAAESSVNSVGFFVVRHWAFRASGVRRNVT